MMGQAGDPTEAAEECATAVFHSHSSNGHSRDPLEERLGDRMSDWHDIVAGTWSAAWFPRTRPLTITAKAVCRGLPPEDALAPELAALRVAGVVEVLDGAPRVLTVRTNLRDLGRRRVRRQRSHRVSERIYRRADGAGLTWEVIPGVADQLVGVISDRRSLRLQVAGALSALVVRQRVRERVDRVLEVRSSRAVGGLAGSTRGECNGAEHGDTGEPRRRREPRSPRRDATTRLVCGDVHCRMFLGGRSKSSGQRVRLPWRSVSELARTLFGPIPVRAEAGK